MTTSKPLHQTCRPTVTISGNGGRALNDFRQDKTTGGQVFWTTPNSGAVTINQPIYTGGKTEAQLVQILCMNPDPTKRLNKEYSGTIYLDGCFTAELKFMNSYAEKFWNSLKSLGYKNVKVKGNLGAATTTGRDTNRI